MILGGEVEKDASTDKNLTPVRAFARARNGPAGTRFAQSGHRGQHAISLVHHSSIAGICSASVLKAEALLLQIVIDDLRVILGIVSFHGKCVSGDDRFQRT